MSVRLAGLALSYAGNIYLSRLLGVRAFGEYVIALSWALVLMLPAKAGFDNSALRFSSIYFENGDAASLRGFIRVAAGTVAGVSLLLAAIILVAGDRFIPVSANTRAWTAALIPLLALLALFSVVIRTARRVIAAQFYEQVLRPLLLILGVAAATLVAHVRLTPGSALAITTFAALAALIGLLVQLRWVLGSSRHHMPSYGGWRQWLAVSVPLLMMGVLQELMNQIDIILLGSLAGHREAALFAASWRLASLVPFALIALATMAGPLVAAAHERGATDELNRIAHVVARAGFAFAVVVAVLLYFGGEWLLGLYGAEFTAAHDVLATLLVGSIVNAFTGIVAYFMTLTGHERQAVVIFAIALVISVALNLYLIPAYGAWGAAVASSGGLAAYNLMMLVYVRRIVGIDASALGLRPRKIASARAKA
jgi:O-antigen/teichoic acid export membrane protein